MSTNPFAVRRASVVAALAMAALPHASAQAPVFRGRVDLVNIAVTVTDRKGGLVTDLRADDFEVREDGRKQMIGYFAAGGDSAAGTPRLHAGVLLDVSQSMAEDIAFARTASIKFLNTLTDAADITLVDFDAEVRVARFSQTDFPRLVERIRQQKVRGSTALYDAIGMYLAGAADQDGRKIMLLYTDGGDTRSAQSLSDLMDLLKRSDVTIYAIGSVFHQAPSYRISQQMVLRQIAEATGGQAFFPGGEKELDRVYAQVLAEIRAQYVIGYLSTNDRADGSWRNVDVKLSKPGAGSLRVRARKGYFAPYRP